MSEEKEKYVELVRRLIPINDLPGPIQNEVMNKAGMLKIRKKGEVFKQGDRDGYSYYVLEGEIEMHANNQLHNTIVGGTERAQYAMAQLQPRQFTARAKTNCVVMQIERDALDKMMVLHEKVEADDEVTKYDLSVDRVEVAELEGEEEVDWMTRMLQSEIFAGMPTANIHQLFAIMEPVEYKAGDIIIKQGEPGQHYYIIQEGRCEVLRQPPSGGKDLRLAVLSPGDSFGEEALIAETTRNATIRMISEGLVAQLSKDDFVNLIKKPTLKAISSEEGKGFIATGGKWLDVRFKNEHERGAIEGSLHIPLNMLRMQSDKLDINTDYVLFCDTGGRSSTGAFLLTERGYTVYFLDGGLVNHPELAPPEEVTQMSPAAEVKPAAPPPKVVSKPSVTPAAPPAIEDDDTTTLDALQKEEIDPEIKASVLQAELARTDKEIEATMIGTTDAARKKIQAEVERKLKEERAKIEVAKKEAEESAKKMRQQEEAKLQQLKAKAAQRLQEEKKKIEEVYSRNAEEMAKLEIMKQEAAEKLRLERERLDKQAEEAKKERADTEKIKAELAAARQAMEEEANKRQLEQDEMEKKIQLMARQKLEEERKKLAAEFSKQNAELEQARREKESAEAARKAAKEESDKVIAEIQSKHSEERNEAEERLKQERIKLEEEQRKIQKALEEVKQAKQEADALRKAAMAEVAALKAKQADEEISKSTAAQEALMKDIKEAESKVNQASVNVAKAQQQQLKVEVTRKDNEIEVAKNTAEQEALKAKLEADLAGFKVELEEEERRYASMTTQLEHMKRIKERAAAAKQAAKDADEGLLGDVAAQLGKEP